jgi:hypothetical protein
MQKGFIMAGRPKLIIDPNRVYELSSLGCTNKEIGHALGCSDDTLEHRFLAELRRGRGDLKEKLRAAQVKLALAGNVTMLIWLGKQYLGQSDTQQTNVDVKLDNKDARDKLVAELSKIDVAK